jgi:hypothetical protein
MARAQSLEVRRRVIAAVAGAMPCASSGGRARRGERLNRRLRRHPPPPGYSCCHPTARTFPRSRRRWRGGRPCCLTLRRRPVHPRRHPHRPLHALRERELVRRRRGRGRMIATGSEEGLTAPRWGCSPCPARRTASSLLAIASGPLCRRADQPSPGTAPVVSDDGENTGAQARRARSQTPAPACAGCEPPPRRVQVG